MQTLYDEINELDLLLEEMESQLSKVLTPSIRLNLLMKIEDIRESIDILRESISAEDTWDEQNILDR